MSDTVVREGEVNLGFPTSIALAADGRHATIADDSGAVMILDLATAIARTRVPRSVLTSPALRPDGTILVVPWWRDPAVYVWDPSTERAVEFACRAAGRDLTKAEWRDHFDSLPYRTPCASLTDQVSPSAGSGVAGRP